MKQAGIKDEEESQKLEQYAMMGKLRTKEKDPVVGLKRID